MTRSTLLRSCAGASMLAALAAASPSVLAGVDGGLWEVSGQGKPVRLCIADPKMLALYEHRGSSCSHDLVRGDGQSAVISYNCAGGAFGQSSISVVTPRSLSIRTQGILGGAPYKYLLEARRIGDCAGH